MPSEGSSGSPESGDGRHADGDCSGGRKHEKAGRGGRGKGGRRGGRSGGRRRNDRGQYVETTTDEDLIALLERLPGPVITTSDVAETFDITTEGARRKLNDLCDRGILDRRKSGQTRLYWQVGEE